MSLRIVHLHGVTWRLLVWALALAASLSGCGVRGRAARETARYTYRTSCDAVIPAVREALRDRGFEPQSPHDDSALALTTEWRDPDPPRKNEHYPTRHRYVANLTATDASSCRLQVHRETSRDEGVLRERDLDVEWAVLRQVDPATARRFEAGGASP